MEMLVDSGALRNAQAEKFLKDADEIVATTAASIKTLRKRSASPNPKSLKPYGDGEVGQKQCEIESE
jgi:hypothetical protein